MPTESLIAIFILITAAFLLGMMAGVFLMMMPGTDGETDERVRRMLEASEGDEQ